MPHIQVLDQITVDKIAARRSNRTASLSNKRTGGKTP